MKAACIVFAGLSALVLSSCQTSRQEVVRKGIFVQPANASQAPLYVWHGSGQPGPMRVTIDLSQQKAFIFRNNQTVGWSYVATGKSGYSTPTGSFAISEKVAEKRSSRYGHIVDGNGGTINSDATAGVSRVPSGGRFVGARMPYWMRLTSYGIGMHAGYIPNPGSPASHGCIRLPHDLAQKLYAEAPTGTRVTIIP